MSGRAKKQTKPTTNSASSKPTFRLVAQNRRARHNYDILDTYECGIVLTGSEVKSLRAGRVNLVDSYARVDKGELWLLGAHIGSWDYAHGFGDHDPLRRRKLLMHRRQIDMLLGRITQNSLTLVPLKIYFHGGIIKVELGLAKGRKLYDKRRSIAERDARLEASRAVKFTISHKHGAV
ncbi:MAG: SsrA-binding protein SmpB [Actinobacteria bacterium]|nr:SsrA-binding protein SmpB [Actinomycetota bacterium]MCL6105491.1 SsrA-binding protein SmpB [Actinomycetota bacterium]